MFKWFYCNNYKSYTPKVMKCAVESENLDLIQYIWNSNIKYDNTRLADLSVELGNIKIFKWLFAQNLRCSSEILEEAAKD